MITDPKSNLEKLMLVLSYLQKVGCKEKIVANWKLNELSH